MAVFKIYMLKDSNNNQLQIDVKSFKRDMGILTQYTISTKINGQKYYFTGKNYFYAIHKLIDFLKEKNMKMLLEDLN
ncbi:hypothetical protein [Candidatus Clostridium helianthi]|jgi:hypothetical protein|uniref:Uncharacterized protein n=1 Tax=Candidatus Clostridium helianthi TaxID=3381660 RepID=A0ABW8S5I3_9CLOT